MAVGGYQSSEPTLILELAQNTRPSQLNQSPYLLKYSKGKKKRKKRKQERKEHPTQHTEVKWFPNINWFWQPGQIFRLPKWENTLEKGKTHNISQINISSNSACPISRPNNHKGVSSYLNDIVLLVSPGVPAWYTDIHLAKPSQQFQYHSQSTML